MRKLVTIRTIDNLSPIEGADAIEVATIDGWKIVVKKTEFNVGDLCVYFEIDSFLPVRPEFEFLRARSFKRMGDVEGFRLKTIRLRGQVSQGLVIPVSAELQEEWSHTFGLDYTGSRVLAAGDDVTELLGVQKYEAAVPTELAGQVRGNFPAFIPRTDQERCQNSGGIIFGEQVETSYERSMKLDGTSFTAFRVDGEEGVCGRNWELSLDETNEHNALVRLYVDSGLQAALRELGLNIATQGELMGPKIQGNREGLTSTKLFVFDMYDIDGACYFTPTQRHEIMARLWALGVNKNMVDHVPVIALNVTLASIGIHTVAQLLQHAEGPSIAHAVKEGDVYKSMDGTFSFKAISNLFLLKEKD